MKKTAYLVPIFIFLFFGIQHSFAATLDSQNLSSTDVSDIYFNYLPPYHCYGTGCTIQYTGVDFGSTDKLDSVDVWIGIQTTDLTDLNHYYPLGFRAIATDEVNNTYEARISYEDLVANGYLGGNVGLVHLLFTIKNGNASSDKLDFGAGHKISMIQFGAGAVSGPHTNYVNIYTNGVGSRDPRYILYDSGGSAVPLAITNPLDTATITASDSFPITGTCPNTGTNKLAFKRDIFNELEPLVYNIDCTSGHTFAFSHAITEYMTMFYIIDQTDGSNTVTNFTAVPSGTSTIDQTLNIIYPVADGSNHYTVHPDPNFKFRFSYKLGASDKKSDAEVKTTRCTDITYESCDAWANLSLSALDTGNSNIFDIQYPVSDGTTYYYKTEIQNAGDGYNTWSKEIKFIVVGSNSSTILADPSVCTYANEGILYPLCSLFIPNATFFQDSYQDIYNQLGTKVPFAYFFLVRDKINSLGTITSSGETLFNPDLPISKGGVVVATLHFPGFNLEDSHLQTLFNDVKPWERIFLWLWLMMYFYRRVLTFTDSEI